MINREPFDPSRTFVAQTFIRLYGRLYRKGETIESGGVEDRVLKRNYEAHKIGFAPSGAVALPEVTEAEQFFNANAQQRQQQIEGAGASSEPPSADEQAAVDKLVGSNNKEQLVEMAEGLVGVTADQTKPVIALAILRAGRGTA